jgi:hypothetical protein
VECLVGLVGIPVNGVTYVGGCHRNRRFEEIYEEIEHPLDDVLHVRYQV